MKRIAFCIISNLFLVCAALAQLPTGTILGTVKDPTGASVVGAQVTATNTDTSQSRTSVTGTDGAYRMDDLAVGNYQIRVEKSGFKTEVQSGLTLNVAQQAVANFTIQVGQVSQTVSVTSEVAQISTTTSSLGSVVNNQSLIDIPLNGRNYGDLTLLQPGITQAVSANTATQVGFNADMFSSNGASMYSNNTMLDGTIMTNQSGGGAASVTGTTLGVDGIQEYKVITNGTDAEYGLVMGAQIAMVSTSGTNRFHGNAYEFIRNSDLDARNYFDLPPSELGGHRLPEFRRNQFGGSFGGPIKKDKTFFFADYEQLIAETGLTETEAVLGAGCHGAAGAVITQAACPQLTVPSVTINSVMAPIVALYPLPNIGTANYGYTYGEPTAVKHGQIRVDQTLSKRDSAFGRYTIDDAQQTSPYDFPNELNVFQSREQFVTLADNHVFSASLLDTPRFSFSRTLLGQENPTTIPISSEYSYTPGDSIGVTTVGGLSGIGANLSAPSISKQNIWAYSDDLVYTRGRHSLKFGAMVNRYQYFSGPGGPSSDDKGVLGFSGVASFLTGAYSSYYDYPSNKYALEDHYLHYFILGFYAQDDWRVRSRLTLNLGLRYEPYTSYVAPTGPNGSIHNLLTDTSVTVGPPFKDPSHLNFGPRVGFAWDVFGDGKTALRGGAGLLYDDSGFETFLPTSAPPFVTETLYGAGQMTIPFTPPNVGTAPTATFHGTEWNIQQPHMWQWNLTAERQLRSFAMTVAYVGSRGIHIFQSLDADPNVPNGVPSNGACVANPASYGLTGAAGLAYAFTNNEVDGTATACWAASPAPIRLNTAWSDIIVDKTTGDSHYNALEVVLNKRLSQGLQLQSAYTWARSFDDTNGQAGSDISGATATYPSDQYHEKTNYGPSDFDLINQWHLSTVYHLPTFGSTTGLKDKIVNGWWMSGIWTVEGGYPFTVFFGTSVNRSNDGAFTGTTRPDEHPDLIAGRDNSNVTHGVSAGCGTGATRANGGTAIAAGTRLGTATTWYDPCAFAVQPAGFLGNEPRNDFRGPGYNFLSYSLVKDTSVHALGEEGKVEFRAEFFNILNHVNFLPPGATGAASGSEVYSGSANVQNPLAAAGQLTATNGTARQIQFGLKIIF